MGADVAPCSSGLCPPLAARRRLWPSVAALQRWSAARAPRGPWSAAPGARRVAASSHDGCGLLFGGLTLRRSWSGRRRIGCRGFALRAPALGSSSCSRSSIGRGTFAQPRLGRALPCRGCGILLRGFRGRPLPAGRLSRLGWSARILSRGRLAFTSRLARLGSRGFRARRLRLTHSSSRCRCIARCRRGRGRCARRLRRRRWRSRFLGGGNRVAVRDLLHPLAVGPVERARPPREPRERRSRQGRRVGVASGAFNPRNWNRACVPSRLYSASARRSRPAELRRRRGLIRWRRDAMARTSWEI